jgi:hypothetical protein
MPSGAVRPVLARRLVGPCCGAFRRVKPDWTALRRVKPSLSALLGVTNSNQLSVTP